MHVEQKLLQARRAGLFALIGFAVAEAAINFTWFVVIMQFRLDMSFLVPCAVSVALAFFIGFGCCGLFQQSIGIEVNRMDELESETYIASLMRRHRAKYGSSPWDNGRARG